MVLHQRGVWGCVVLLLFAAAPVWAQARLPESLRKHVESKSARPVDVIVHGSPDEVRALAARHGLRVKKTLSEGAVFEANAAGVEALAADVDHLSRDVEVTSFMAVTNAAIGADQVQAGLEGVSSFTGAGVGVAIVDSGVWAGHRSLAGRGGVRKGFRQRRHRPRGRTAPSAAEGSSKDDPYGHGTHIGATVAGSSPYPADSTSQTPFRGVAPGANLISLRVIGADGTGKASDVIAAIHWTILNRKRFNIRVINLSLGGPAEQSYRDDPMCEAVERAVHAGIVVVVAAGNRGKDAEGHSVHGLIESPGIDPHVITVGALNTKNTARRSDDLLATYSSKGPTLVDGFLKPDIAAPGNKIVSAEAQGASLVANYPALHASGSGADAYATPQRDEHGDGGRERRSGAGAGGEQTADAGAGQDGAAVVGDVHPGSRSGRRRRREPEHRRRDWGGANRAGAADDGDWRRNGCSLTGVMVVAGPQSELNRNSVEANEILWGNHLIWGDHLIWG